MSGLHRLLVFLLFFYVTLTNGSISSKGRKENQADLEYEDEVEDYNNPTTPSDDHLRDRESQRQFANATAQNVTFLLDHLLQQYDNSLRPDIRGPPLVVEINMQVRSMGPISEVDMTYSMDCYFRQSWVDRRLAYSGRKNLALSIEMLRKIWKPDTYIFNGRKSYLHTITTPNKFVRLFPNGRVLYSQRLTIRASCQMDLSDFPMDKQNCPLYIGSFGYSKDDVLYRWTKGRGVNIASDMKLSQFDLIQTPTGNANTIVNKDVHSTLVVGFLLQRHMGNFVIQVYGPCVLLVVISWVSFWLNREATSDRISLGVTTVLTMTFLGLEARTDLPQVAYPTALDYFVFISFVFIFSTVVQFALVHYFTKLGAGEYYLEELEETICLAEERLRQKRTNKAKDHDEENPGHNTERNPHDSGDLSLEDTSFSGNSNTNVYNGSSGADLMCITTNNGSSIRAATASATAAGGSGSDCWRNNEVNQSVQQQHHLLHPNVLSIEDSSSASGFFSSAAAAAAQTAVVFDNTILIDPLQRHRDHLQQVPVSTAAVYSDHHRSVIRHNCLNHHPYGTFYYSKKSGKTGRHFHQHSRYHEAPNAPLPSLPDSPTLNSFHHTVMAGGPVFGGSSTSPMGDRTNVNSAASNFRTSSTQSSVAAAVVAVGSHGNSSKRRILDWAKSWKRYKKRMNSSSTAALNNSSNECQCKRCITRAMNNPEKALNSVSQIDKISRIVFPMAFAILNAFYWFSYLKHSHRIDLSFESS